MSIFLKEQEKYIKDILKELNYEVEEVTLNVSSRPEFGDYQYNGVMGLAKENHKNPRPK
jgi:arginyl-tRNA synthetase